MPFKQYVRRKIMAEEQKLKFGEYKCPVCGANITSEVNKGMMDKTIVVCPNCGIDSPVMSSKQRNGFASLWTFAVLGPVVGVWLRFSNIAKVEDLAGGLLRTISVIVLVAGGICLACAVVFTVLRKKMLNKAKLKWQAEHPAA
jgi:predicted RNA-binding Zn-ribbon protein involved in translation (DUF1610 family)